MENISPIPVAFGQAFKQQRRAKGITQQELGERCHLGRSYISHIELEEPNPVGNLGLIEGVGRSSDHAH